MKIMLFMCFLLVSVQAFADQTLNGRQPREWRQSTNQKILEGKDYQGDTTAITNLVATGHQAAGNPGYIALVAQDGGTGNTVNVQSWTYYLWVRADGKLLIASFPTLTPYASFPYGDWRTPNFNAGTVVGSQ